MHHRARLLLLLPLFAACESYFVVETLESSASSSSGGSLSSSSSSSGGAPCEGNPNTLTGPLAFQVRRAILEPSLAWVALYDRDGADLCSSFYAAGFRSIRIGLGYGDEGPVGPGTYEFSGDHTNPRYIWHAVGLGFDDAGVWMGTANTAGSVSGAITLTTAEASRVTGCFTTTLRDADGGFTPLGGTFDAVTCP
ncbi:MAG: hypothetical protein AB2A00_31320 [Myxococcota bacterium]